MVARIRATALLRRRLRRRQAGKGYRHALASRFHVVGLCAARDARKCLSVAGFLAC
jgi:hypothetical protein